MLSSCWAFLSANPNPEAIKLLKKYPKRIDWGILSENPNPEAIELLKKNKDSINWHSISRNPAIFDEVLE